MVNGLKLRIKYSVGKWIMWGYTGRVLYPFMLFRAAKEDIPDWLFRHEFEHVYQVREHGWWKFHLMYLWELIRYGYRDNFFEIVARSVENQPLTKRERELINRRTK